MDKDKIREQASFLFSCAEYIVREWIAKKFMHKDYIDVFDDKQPELPAHIPVHVGDKNYKVMLTIVPHDYFAHFPDDAKIAEAVSFLAMSVRIVKNAVTKTMRDCPKLLTDIDFIEEHGTMKPIVVPEIYRLYIHESSQLDRMLEFYKKLCAERKGPEDQKMIDMACSHIHEQQKKVSDLEAETSTPQFKKYVTDTTGDLFNVERIGIVCLPS